jgi:hypothetical protein
MQDMAIQNVCLHRVESESATVWDQTHVKLQTAADNTKDLFIYRAGLDISQFAFLEEDDLVVLKLSDVSLGGPIAFLSSGEPIVASYTVKDSDTCPICNGAGYSDDFLEVDDNLLLVESEDGLAQMMEKIIATVRTSNPFHKWFGSDLHTMLGSKIDDVTFVNSTLESMVRDAIERFRDSYERIWGSVCTVELGDILTSVDRVASRQDEDEPSLFYIEVDYTTGSGEGLSLEQSVRLGYFKAAE